MFRCDLGEFKDVGKISTSDRDYLLVLSQLGWQHLPYHYHLFRCAAIGTTDAQTVAITDV